MSERWFDPCPMCGAEVTGVGYEAQYMVSNPESVLVCGPGLAIPNPDPPEELNEYRLTGSTLTFEPCGHQRDASLLRAWRMYEETAPA